MASRRNMDTNNHKPSAVQSLITESQDRDMIRLYRLLFEGWKEEGITFDP